jgi:hypothetical protein
MIILYGQPRSKTSMMMRVLEFGGVPCEYTDETQRPREKFRNPYGFFEIAKPTHTKCFKLFVPLSMSKVAKTAKIIFIQRDLEQHIKSWEAAAPSREHRERCTKYRKIFEDDLEGYTYLKIKTEDMLADPRRECERVREFIKDEVDFDVEKAITAIDHSLTVIR